MRKVELLAPAGNMECLKAAISNGADAVYLGGKNFSARAFANNFDDEELIEAIRYAHLRNVRIFVTLNTLLSEKEIQQAIERADFYYRNNVDALLIQDLGLYYILKEKYPDFELHCSTQMHVHNLSGIRNARKLGFSRVVIARESTLEFIKEACKEDIEIEVFVHGAICVSYSGQCLMSSATKSRSANKGMCAQCCRLKYELYDENDQKIETDTDYLISPKDMMLIRDIPALIDAGVSSFKIEGRMKSAAYVGYVTSLYRKAIDAYLNKESFELSDRQMKELKVLFNRNFTNDLLYGRNTLFGQKTPNHLGIEIGKVLYHKNHQLFIRLSDNLHQFDGIRINEYGCIVNRLYKDGLLVDSANAGDIISIDHKDPLSGKVYKTIDYLLEERMKKVPDKKVPLSIEAEIYPGKDILLNLRQDDTVFTYRSSIAAQVAQRQPLTTDSFRKQFDRLNETPYRIDSLTLHTENAFLPLKDLNQLRREAIEAFNRYRLEKRKKADRYAEVEFKEIKDEKRSLDMIQNGDHISLDQNLFPVGYVINPDSKYPDSEIAVISEFGGLLRDYKQKIAYYTLNCCNSYTYEFLKRLGFDSIILSTELNEIQIDDLIESYEKRTNKKIYPFVLKKGNRVLMYLKSDPFEKYTQDNKTYYLNDGNNIYRIRKNNSVTELVEQEQADSKRQSESCNSFLILD